MTVSYTHLDVYKRQGRDVLDMIGCAAGQTCASAGHSLHDILIGNIYIDCKINGISQLSQCLVQYFLSLIHIFARSLNKLQNNSHSCVTLTLTDLNDSGVTTLTVCILGSDLDVYKRQGWGCS